MGILPPDLQAGRGKGAGIRMLSGISSKPTRNGCSHMPSSAICAMPTRHPNFREWPKYASLRCKRDRKDCAGRTLPTIRISPSTYYIQFHLHLQLLAATEHARANGVVLKGDIPIGISRNSVEAWTGTPLLQPERTSRRTAR